MAPETVAGVEESPKLRMTNCHLVGNGGMPLELTNAHRHHLEQNVMDFAGVAPVASSVLASIQNEEHGGDDESVEEV
jgi:hypothetical protein